MYQIQKNTDKFTLTVLIQLINRSDSIIKTYDGVPVIQDVLDGDNVVFKFKPLINIIFNKDLLQEVIYHTKHDIINDYSNISILIRILMFKYYSPIFSSSYRFKDEDDFIRTLQECGYATDQMKTTAIFENKTSASQNVINYVTTIAGFDMVKSFGYIGDEYTYIIDINELAKYEHRKGYWKTNGELFLTFKEGIGFQFFKLNMDGNTYTEGDDLEFPMRKFMTGVFTITTIRKHLSGCHFEVSDKANVIIEKELSTTNPVRRLLGPISFDPYRTNENSANALLGQSTLVAQFTNLSVEGVNEYLMDTRKTFDLRQLVNTADILERSTGQNITSADLAYIMGADVNPTNEISDERRAWWVNVLRTLPSGNHLCKWWGIIYQFAHDFINLHYPYDYITADVQHFMEVTYQAYPNFKREQSDKQNLIELSASLLNVCLIHEMYSNPIAGSFYENPFVQTTTWLENDSARLVDHISNMSGCFSLLVTSYGTQLTSKKLGDDFTHLCGGYKKDEEIKIFKRFQKEIAELKEWFEENGFSKESYPLHPDNIECSVRW